MSNSAGERHFSRSATWKDLEVDGSGCQQLTGRKKVFVRQSKSLGTIWNPYGWLNQSGLNCENSDFVFGTHGDVSGEFHHW